MSKPIIVKKNNYFEQENEDEDIEMQNMKLGMTLNGGENKSPLYSDLN